MNYNIDKHLVEGLKSGSMRDFDRLYAIYADLLYGFVLNLTKSPSDAKDIVQETFLRIWQTRAKLSVGRSFKSYLYTIAHNLIIDAFRSKIESVVFEDYICSEAYQNHTGNVVEQVIDFDEFTRQLALAKEKLSGKQKEIFELSKEKEYSTEFIAQRLHISEKTVKNQLSLALKTLKSELLLSYLGFLLFL